MSAENLASSGEPGWSSEGSEDGGGAGAAALTEKLEDSPP